MAVDQTWTLPTDGGGSQVWLACEGAGSQLSAESLRVTQSPAAAVRRRWSGVNNATRVSRRSALALDSQPGLLAPHRAARGDW